MTTTTTTNVPTMKFRVYHSDKKGGGQYTVVEADSRGTALLKTKHLFPHFKAAKLHVSDAQKGDEPDGKLHQLFPPRAD